MAERQDRGLCSAGISAALRLRFSTVLRYRRATSVQGRSPCAALGSSVRFRVVSAASTTGPSIAVPSLSRRHGRQGCRRDLCPWPGIPVPDHDDHRGLFGRSEVRTDGVANALGPEGISGEFEAPRARSGCTNRLPSPGVCVLAASDLPSMWPRLAVRAGKVSQSRERHGRNCTVMGSADRLFGDPRPCGHRGAALGPARTDPANQRSEPAASPAVRSARNRARSEALTGSRPTGVRRSDQACRQQDRCFDELARGAQGVACESADPRT